MLTDILVVENNRRLRFNIEQTISRMDLAVNNIYQASNGKEGLEILQQQSVDLILTDINMPVMDGLEMLGQIRSDPVLPNVPTIVISSRRDAKLLKAISSCGLRYLRKPFSWRGLRKKILNFKSSIPDYVKEA